MIVGGCTPRNYFTAPQVVCVCGGGTSLPCTLWRLRLFRRAGTQLFLNKKDCMLSRLSNSVCEQDPRSSGPGVDDGVGAHR